MSQIIACRRRHADIQEEIVNTTNNVRNLTVVLRSDGSDSVRAKYNETMESLKNLRIREIELYKECVALDPYTFKREHMLHIGAARDEYSSSDEEDDDALIEVTPTVTLPVDFKCVDGRLSVLTVVINTRQSKDEIIEAIKRLMLDVQKMR